jgi:hypothetical protein
VGPGGVKSDPRAFSPNEIWMDFGDGRYLFKLKLKQLAELQEKCGAGIGEIYARVVLGHYRVEDLVHGIRLGLVGGAQGIVDEVEVKVSPELANKLTERYCDRPLEDVWMIAKLIYQACIHGYDNPEVKKRGNVEAATEMTSETDGSTSPRPTQTESPSED